MKNRFISGCILLLLFFALSSQAQVSGYMGSRNVIKLALFMKSSFVMPNVNGKSGYFSFNDRFSLEYERVISRNKSLAFHVGSFETFYKTYGYSDYESAPLLKMSCKTIGGDYIMYQASHLAPLGAYTSFGFDVIFSKAEVDTAAININSNGGNNYAKFSNTEISTIHLGLNLKSGVKQIFFNHLSLDFNFQLGVIFAENVTGNADFNNNPEEFIKGRIGNRLWGHYLWGVNCSLGYLF